MSGWYIPQGMLKSLTKSQISQKAGKMTGMLNNSAVGQATGKTLFSPQPSVTREHNYDGVVPKNTGRQLKDAVTTTKNMAEGKKFEDTYLQRDESNPVYDTQPKKPTFWGTIKQSMSKFPTPGSLTVKNIMNR